MKTSKIYIETAESSSNTTITTNDFLKTIYTIPNDLQLVKLVLQSNQSYNFDGKENVFIQITSGNGELQTQNSEIKAVTTVVIPKGIKWTLKNSTDIATTANLLFSKPVYTSSYIQKYSTFGESKKYVSVFGEERSENLKSLVNYVYDSLKTEKSLWKTVTAGNTGLFNPSGFPISRDPKFDEALNTFYDKSKNKELATNIRNVITSAKDVRDWKFNKYEKYSKNCKMDDGSREVAYICKALVAEDWKKTEKEKVINKYTILINQIENLGLIKK